MRELAAVALIKGISQERLASMYADVVGGVASGANVMRSFNAHHPTGETVHAYRRALKVTTEHLDLAAGRGLKPHRRAGAFTELDNDFVRLLSPEVVDAARTAFAALHPDEKLRLAESFMLEKYRRAHMVLAPHVDRPEPALNIVQRLLPDINIHMARRYHDPSDSFLSTILVAARGVLSDARRDALLAVARALACEQGLNTEAMDLRLKRAMNEGTTGHFYKAAHRAPDHDGGDE